MTRSMPPRRKSDVHLPPCVYQKHGAYWYVKGGKWSRLGTDLRTALAEYARRVGEKATGGMPALIDRAMVEILRSVKESTAKQYRQAAKVLKDELADFQPHQVEARDVAQLKVHWAKIPNMANRRLSLLRQIFALAVEWQIVNSNPCVGIRRHKEAKRGRYLTDAEYAAVWRAGSPSLRAAMDLAYLTGQRIGDVLRIRMADVSDEGISFRQSKTGARVLVRMSPDLREAVDAAKALPRPVRGLTLLCTLRGGRPYAYGTVKDMWNRACEDAGVVDAHLHDLRAKSLTDAKAQGKNAQALGGHATEAMTLRYIRQRETVVAEPPRFRQPPKVLDKSA